jgi:hypothetical protein
MSKVWFELSKKDSELCIVLLISVNAGDNFCTTDAMFGKLICKIKWKVEKFSSRA